jgi:hypothetical protein
LSAWRERGEHADTVELSAREARGRVGREDPAEVDVVLGQPFLGQALEEEEVVDHALFGRDGLALQVGDGLDRRVTDDGVVAGRVVVHRDDGLLRSAGDGRDGVVERLGVGVELPGGHRVERRDVVGEVLEVDVETVLLEDPGLVGHRQREPARPRAVADRDLVGLRGLCRRRDEDAGGGERERDHGGGDRPSCAVIAGCAGAHFVVLLTLHMASTVRLGCFCRRSLETRSGFARLTVSC